MMRSRILVAVLLSALTACGGDDDDDDSKDQRSNVTGKYDVEGTMDASAGGESESEQIVDVVVISNGTGSNQALNLELQSLGCGPQATMTGDRSFSVVETECDLPGIIEECTSTMVYKSGQGSRDASGALTLTASGTLEVDCGFGTFSGPFNMNLTGTHAGQALPDTQAQALANTDTPTAVLRRLVQAARR